MKPPPRRPRLADAGWLLFGLATVASYTLGVVMTVGSAPSGARLPALLWSLAWGLPAYLLVRGAWRRTAWALRRPGLWWLRPSDDESD